MKLLVVKNCRREGPGLIAEAFHEKNVEFDVVDVSLGYGLPSPETYSGIVVLGGPASANDASPAIARQLEFIRSAVEAGKPFLGVCLGMQLLVKAFGGMVAPAKIAEAGFRGPDGSFYAVELTGEGRGDPLFKDLPSYLKAFQLHSEEVVALPDSAVLLGLGNFSPVQVVRVGNKAYGLQGHFELTRLMLERWASEDPTLSSVPRESLVSDFEQIEDEYREAGLRLFRNFLEIVEQG